MSDDTVTARNIPTLSKEEEKHIDDIIDQAIENHLKRGVIAMQKHREYDVQNRKMIDFYKGLSAEELDRLIEIEENKIKKQSNTS